MLGVDDAVMVAGRRHAAAGLVVGRKGRRRLRAEGGSQGTAEDDGPALSEEADILVDGESAGNVADAGAAQVVLVRLVLEPT